MPVKLGDGLGVLINEPSFEVKRGGQGPAYLAGSAVKSPGGEFSGNSGLVGGPSP